MWDHDDPIMHKNILNESRKGSTKKTKNCKKICELKIFFWQRIGCVCRNCHQNYANTVFIHTISLNIHVYVYILEFFGRVCAFRPALYIGVAGRRNVGPIYKQMFSTSMIEIQIFKSFKKVPIHTRSSISNSNTCCHFEFVVKKRGKGHLYISFFHGNF
jgi:hypothetical protein